MSEECAKTLILKRDTGVLWIQQEERDIGLLYDVTGVERLPGDSNPVSILCKEKIIGIVWDVKEIKERL